MCKRQRTTFHPLLAFVVSILLCISASATLVKIRVTDPVGASGVSKVFIIVRSLESGKGDGFRDLSGPDGHVPPYDLTPGLYEVIAMYPHGYWFTQARDFEVADTPITIELHLDGAIVDAIPIDRIELRVRVVDRGRAIADAWVVGRDSKGDWPVVARTDEHGEAIVQIPLGGAEVTAISHGISHVQEVNIPTEKMINCENVCIVHEIDKVKKTPHTISIELGKAF
jgi:hypothetical protein